MPMEEPAPLNPHIFSQYVCPYVRIKYMYKNSLLLQDLYSSEPSMCPLHSSYHCRNKEEKSGKEKGRDDGFQHEVVMPDDWTDDLLPLLL